jgi:hypothetical protein
MSKKVFNEDLQNADEGVSIGKVGSYVQRFKEQEKRKDTIPFNPKKNFLKNDEYSEDDFEETSIKSSSKIKKIQTPRDPNVLPEKITEDNEKTVYVYYYCKFGNLDCDDFSVVKGKIASAINRLYNKSTTPQEALEKLEKYVTPADIVTNEEEDIKPTKINIPQISKPHEKQKINIKLEEKSYPFVKNLDPLDDEQKDLLMFINIDNLCFSSDDYDFFLTVKNKDCFDKLFDFDIKENMVYSMFREQLGDDYKAKKLVLMSRILNQNQSENKNATKKKKN